MAEEQKREIKRRNRPDALMKIIRDLDKAAPGAVSGLVDLCKSQDEKIKLDACKAVLNIRGELQDQQEKRDLQVLLVQHKLGNGLRRDEPDETPLVDFEQIQDVN